MEGIEALLFDPDARSSINLTDAQYAKVRSLAEARTRSRNEIVAKLMRGTIDKKEAGEEMATSNAAFKTQADEILNEDQRAKFKALEGKPFPIAG